MRDSAAASQPVGAPAWRRARELVLSHGWNATAYQILNPGIEHWFGAAGDAVAGYVDCRRVRVVAGAPICPPERLASVAAELEREAGREGRRVCYFGAEERLEAIYRAAPSHAMVLLGAQPAWRPAHWPSEAAHRQSLRAQLHRARNKGVAVAEWPSGEGATHPALARCLSEWLADRRLPPLHFLVEPETLAAMGDRRLFVAARAGEVVAFLVASPVPRRDGWLVEQIVRGAAAPNGTAELLIDAAVSAFAGSGSRYVTLGLSPLSRRARLAGDPNPLWLRAVLAWVRAHGRRFYNFDGLDAFKAKFRPERWEPVYAISNEARFSLVTLHAIAAAFSRGAPLALLAQAILRAVRSELAWWARGHG